MITAQLLRTVMPLCRAPDQWVEPFGLACAKFNITNAHRVSMFLAQCAHESGSFNRLSENMNYSAERMMEVWPSRFPTPGSAAPYANNPEKLANRVYANRLGNADAASGDGWRYRGQGLIHTTGKKNMMLLAAGTGLDVVDHPEILLSPGPASLAAAFYWHSNRLNPLADVGDFEEVTRKINSGMIGYADRLKFFTRARAALGLSTWTGAN